MAEGVVNGEERHLAFAAYNAVARAMKGKGSGRRRGSRPSLGWAPENILHDQPKPWPHVGCLGIQPSFVLVVFSGTILTFELCAFPLSFVWAWQVNNFPPFENEPSWNFFRSRSLSPSLALNHHLPFLHSGCPSVLR